MKRQRKSMMKNPKLTQQLKLKWDEKLKKSGFEDIESDEYNLKNWDSFRFQRLFTPDQFEANQRWWELVSQLTHEFKFKSARDKKIWSLYTSGETVRNISKKVKYSKTFVSKTILSIIKLAGL